MFGECSYMWLIVWNITSFVKITEEITNDCCSFIYFKNMSEIDKLRTILCSVHRFEVHFFKYQMLFSKISILKLKKLNK